jgi:hypothetical protein
MVGAGIVVPGYAALRLRPDGAVRHASAVNDDQLAGRAYARVYRTTGRADLHAFLRLAVARAGGRVLYASSETRAPIFLGVQGPSDERLGVLIYPFRVTHRLTRNRPTDEHRLQIRYGAESSWGGDHILGRDVASVDITRTRRSHGGWRTGRARPVLL